MEPKRNVQQHRILRAAGRVALVLVALLLGLLVLCFKELALSMMRPRTTFAAAPSPAAPDPASPGAWSALPDREDAADVALPALPAVGQTVAPADVFYIHPTTYVANHWNGPIDDARLNADTDRVATRLQVSAFNGCCAIYAPRYRQANGYAFFRPSADGQQAQALALSDVVAAFRYYLAHHNHGRPFIVAGHSQGALLGYRLLAAEISRKPVRGQLVAAYLVGGAITIEGVARDLPDIPVCATPEQTGCVVGWNARGEHYVQSEYEMKLWRDPQATQTQAPMPLEHRLCVNPLTFRADGAAAGAEQNQGALFWDAPAPAVLPHYTGAVCTDGTLVVSLTAKPPRDLLSRVADSILGPENYHPIEYQLFYVNLRNNARLRVDAYLRARQAPAPMTAPM